MFYYQLVKNTDEHAEGILQYQVLGESRIRYVEYFSSGMNIGKLLCELLGYDSMHYVSKYVFTKKLPKKYAYINLNYVKTCCLV